MNLPLASIKADGGTQPRDQLDLVVVGEYAEAMANGATFPPVTVFYDGSAYWLADGFHRLRAAEQLGRAEIAADVRQGARRDAVLFSVGANANHGLRRTNEDKRRSVLTLLADEEWARWSDREIARRAGVSDRFVNTIRPSVSANHSQIQTLTPVTFERAGVQYTMQTANIGRTPPPEPSTESIGFDDDYVQDDEQDEYESELEEANSARHAGFNIEIPEPPVTLPTFVERESPGVSSRPVFNRTNDNIDWAHWSWNPVTGCNFNCPYCYARDIANRFYPQGFTPTFHPERLNAPKNTILPASAATDIGERNVFVCSMADLFGGWVPQEWIDAVMESVRNAPQWNFLFLTKNPKRLTTIDWPANAWVGTTVDTQKRVAAAVEAFANVKASVRFLSCEPLKEHLVFPTLEHFDWVIIGGQSRSSGEPEMQPDYWWAHELAGQAHVQGCQVYFKPNLTARPREYPENGR